MYIRFIKSLICRFNDFKVVIFLLVWVYLTILWEGGVINFLVSDSEVMGGSFILISMCF